MARSLFVQHLGPPPTPLIMHCQNCTCRATSRHAEIGFSADLMLPAQVAAAWCARNFLKDPGHAEQQRAAQELGYWCCLHSLWLLSNCFFLSNLHPAGEMDTRRPRSRMLEECCVHQLPTTCAFHWAGFLPYVPKSQLAKMHLVALNRC